MDLGGAIFIFTNNPGVNIGAVRHQQRFSRPRGSNPYSYTRTKRSTTPHMMFSRLMEYDYERPSYIWATERGRKCRQ